MPIYAFKCTSGYIFDALKPMNQCHEAECPKCGQMAKRYWGGRGSPLIKFKSIHEPGKTGWDRIDNAAYYDKSKRKNLRDYEGG